MSSEPRAPAIDGGGRWGFSSTCRSSRLIRRPRKGIRRRKRAASRRGRRLPPPAGGGLGSPRKVVTILVGWVIAIALIVIVVFMWLDAFGSLFDLLDDETLSGDKVGALAAMVVVATAPLLAVHERRRFAWTPAHRAERDAGLLARAGWGLGLLVFAILAAVVWLRVIGEYFDALDATMAITFAEAFGLGVMALIATAPLGYIVWRRHTQRPLRAARWSSE